MRILLVDDEPALRELLRATFEGADVTVDEAESGLEAEARIRRRRPDVIVLDLRMPGMSGAELCKRLKADERTKDIPIVLLTGADPEEARHAQRAGAAALVHKPFSPLDLLAVVERVSGRTPVARRPRRAKPADQELVLYARDLRHLLDIERGQRALLEESYLATVTSLAGALESRDTRTGAHSQRVQRYAIELLELIDPGRVEREPGRAVRVPAARHRQDRDPRRDPAEAGPADPRRAAAHADAHGARRADARRRRRAAGRGSPRRPLASRALGRPRVSRRARRRRRSRSRRASSPSRTRSTR